MLDILAHRTYRHLFLAQVIALVGTGLTTVALVVSVVLPSPQAPLRSDGARRPQADTKHPRHGPGAASLDAG